MSAAKKLVAAKRVVFFFYLETSGQETFSFSLVRKELPWNECFYKLRNELPRHEFLLIRQETSFDFPPRNELPGNGVKLVSQEFYSIEFLLQSHPTLDVKNVWQSFFLRSTFWTVIVSYEINSFSTIPHLSNARA